MKTIKLHDNVHKEMKIYLAKNPDETITDFVGFATIAELKNRGHKFVVNIKQSKKKA